MLGLNLGVTSCIVSSVATAVVPFVFTIATTGAAETMTIPAQNIGVFNAIIDWGDGSTSPVTAYNDAGLSHVYAVAGTYTISVSGVFPNVYFDADLIMAAKVQTVESLGDMGWISLKGAFRDCAALTSFNGAGDVSGVTDFSFALANIPATVVDVSTWDTSSALDMQYLFYKSRATILAVDGFIVNTVTNFVAVFFDARAAVIDVSTWVTTSATSTSYMFYKTSATVLDLTNFDTMLVTDFSYMLSTVSATVLDVSGFVTTAATTTKAMFYNTTISTLAVGGFDMSGVLDMSFMFSSTGVLDAAIDGWDISAATSLSSFMAGVTLPTSRYDATLIAWEALTVTSGLDVDFGGSIYTAGGAAATARSNLVSVDAWIISDGGSV